MSSRSLLPVAGGLRALQNSHPKVARGAVTSADSRHGLDLANTAAGDMTLLFALLVATVVATFLLALLAPLLLDAAIRRMFADLLMVDAGPRLHARVGPRAAMSRHPPQRGLDTPGGAARK